MAHVMEHFMEQQGNAQWYFMLFCADRACFQHRIEVSDALLGTWITSLQALHCLVLQLQAPLVELLVQRPRL